MPAEEELRRTVRNWYDYAAELATANDFGPALQLAEHDLALYDPADAGHAEETAP